VCLGIPMKLVERSGTEAVAELSGVRRAVLLDMVPEAELGQYVIIHAGYAIQLMDETEALEVLELLRKVLPDEELEPGGVKERAP
jgi:hydrogenase expression/formation protein HypC